jgi:hypothetical protein
MLYRAAIVGIIAFWAVMMGLLVRLETHPETTDILDVPVSYVTRLMFKHGQTSFLTVRDETKQIGTIYLRPATTGTDGRSLNFSGALTMQLPTAQAERFNFNGAIDMDAALRMQDFHVDLSIRQPACRVSVAGDAARNTLAYTLRIGSQPATSQTVPMDSSVSSVLGQYPELQAVLPLVPSSVSPPVVTAREAQISWHGEQMEVYQLTVVEASSPVIDFYVTQLGQIISAKTNFGYTLSAEDGE